METVSLMQAIATGIGIGLCTFVAYLVGRNASVPAWLQFIVMMLIATAGVVIGLGAFGLVG